MKNMIIFSVLLIVPLAVFAQGAEEKETPKDGWYKTGNIGLVFNQAAFNAEWQSGGTSNYSSTATLAYDFNYRQGKLTWDNRILGEYGMTKIKDEEFARKTNDRVEFNSILGQQLKDTNWYYSVFLNFRTQFAKGYNFSEDANGNTVRDENSRFLSPGYLQFGPGFLWKKSDNLKVNLAPATARFIFVNSTFTDVTGNDAIAAFNAAGGYYGVAANKTLRFELGMAIGAYAKFEPMKNITLENILNMYSNYLEDPQNVDVDYTLNLVLKANEWINATATFQAIYDDNAVQGFQIRETLGIGIGYKF
ncbi:MAG: DUF3078 domain-containing protein [Marinirhabdus sp.]